MGSALTSMALQQRKLLPDVMERFDPQVRAQIEKEAFKPVEERMADELLVLFNIAKDRDAALMWNGFDGPKHADCKYFGIYQYGDAIGCTAENIRRYLLVEGVYDTCRQRLHQLLKIHDPDTFGWDAAKVGARLGRVVALDDLAVEGNPSLGTFRGNNRYRWYKLVCAYLSFAHWALGVRSGFLYAVKEFDNAASKEVLEAWGPEAAQNILGAMWGGARNAGKKFFLPLSMQSFCAFTIDPGLNAPWVVQSEGRDLDSQRLSEKKRGRRRRAERGMERDGYVAKKDWMNLVGAKTQADKSNPQQGWARVLLGIWEEGGTTRIDDRAMPESTFLIRLFSTRGNSLRGLKEILGRGSKDVLVPSGDLLVQYVRAFAEPTATRSFLNAYGAVWEIYLVYLERFAEILGTIGITLSDINDMKKQAQMLKSAKISGSIMGALSTIAVAISGVAAAAPYGTIIAVIVYVVVALVALFTWLFGGAYRGCPAAPRPMMIKTFAGENVCNFDITGDRSLGDAYRNVIATAGEVGIVLADPYSGVEPPPAGLFDQDWPVFDNDLGAPPGVSPVVLGAGAVAVAVALFAAFGGK